LCHPFDFFGLFFWWADEFLLIQGSRSFASQVAKPTGKQIKVTYSPLRANVVSACYVHRLLVEYCDQCIYWELGNDSIVSPVILVCLL
jgi:hypothetical protein